MTFPLENLDLNDLMLKCIELAKQANNNNYKPLVGAIVVTPNGMIRGQGYRYYIGKGLNMIMHAERAALDSAIGYAPGSCLITTLEPCVRVTRKQLFSSCSELIVERGIDTVVYGLLDKSACFNASAGVNYLYQHGINVKRFNNEAIQELIIKELMWNPDQN